MTRALAFGIVLSLALSGASVAQDAPISISLSIASPALRVNETGEVIAVVSTDASASGALLITPTSDGPAIEVVRGRLLRADAEDPRSSPLRFHVPFVALNPGDALVRVRVDGWSCRSPEDGGQERCHAVRAESAIPLTVRR